MTPSSSSSYLDQLNDIQRKAVTTIDGPVMVIAGPGSGKTRVLTYRIAYLIEQGAAPWEILALTFTNKSAKEMKERIEKVVGPKARRVWAGTFHSLFARILRVEAHLIGYPSNFTIYDTDDSKSLVKVLIKELNLNPDLYNVNSIRNRISSAKSKLITPKLYAQNTELQGQDRMAKMPHFHKIYTAYTQRCKKAGAMDFDDLLYRLYELLQSQPEVLQRYRERFKHVMVDEFQDTNHLQYAIVKKLVQYPESKRNICVVGDDAQSIYAFRGATIENILDYEKDFKKHGIQVFKLEQNYRSTEHIVQAANEIITYNKKQIQKKIWSNKGDGQLIQLIQASSDSEEGKRIAGTILEQKTRNHLYNKDIAILYRTNSQSRVFEEYLRRYNINYRVYGGLSFYQRKEVKDMIAYLRLAVNINDEEAFRRVVNFPKRGVGKTSIDKINAFANQQDITIWKAAKQIQLPPRTRTSLNKFISIIENGRRKLETANAFEIADMMARRSGVKDFYKKDNSIEGMSRQENMESLLNGIQAFVDEDKFITNEDGEEVPIGKSLGHYLQNIALLTDFDKDDPDQADHVTLMSVHAAKGLEYKSVFVTGLEEKLFPSFMSIDTPEGLDEERRLFYVAITRAEQFLTLSFAKSRYRFGKMTYGEPSRFLTEIPQHHLNNRLSARTYMPIPESNAAPSRSGVQGNFKRKTPNAVRRISPADFKPSPGNKIQTGMTVLHLKFGKGRVINVDNGVAHIHFKAVDNPDKKIMLKFAKLQIVT